MTGPLAPNQMELLNRCLKFEIAQTEEKWPSATMSRLPASGRPSPQVNVPMKQPASKCPCSPSFSGVGGRGSSKPARLSHKFVRASAYIATDISKGRHWVHSTNYNDKLGLFQKLSVCRCQHEFDLSFPRQPSLIFQFAFNQCRSFNQEATPPRSHR